MSESHRHAANRLGRELSPYLQQHADNPIDWYPWGQEAFSAARSQDKPIFLSIGYATCHWCHVMEKESFENSELADLLNEIFINIKVDREELPQVDSLYMEFAQALLGGGGGWPLNLVLTPELKPIFAATYLPPEAKGGQLGLKQLALRIRELWRSPQHDFMLEQADQIVQSVAEGLIEVSSGTLQPVAILELVLELFYKMADPLFGGIQGAPKFPMGFQLNFLLRHAFLHSESRALFFVQTTLEMMHRGGIYDHLGGGFSRYAVDSEWLIPHFEKMLYDNAILVVAYTEAWRLTRHALYRGVAEDILRYLFREMRAPTGAFYSAQDADTEGREGVFYTWGHDEILTLLGPRDGRLFCEFYGVTPRGNFEGRNVLHIPVRLEEFATTHKIDPLALAERLAEGRTRLEEARERRVHPQKDDKIITAWNGLMIRALTEAGTAFRMPEYVAAAVQVADFIAQELWIEGKLLRCWRTKRVGMNSCVEDYAYLISGLLSLFNACGESRHLAWAIELTNILTEEFRSQDGVFYRSDGQDPDLIVRQVEMYDGAEPSGNSVQAENLLRLYQITGAHRYRQEAEGVMAAAAGFLEQHPLGGVYHCMALQRVEDVRAATLVIALNEHEELRSEIQDALSHRFAPHAEIIWRKEDDNTLFELIPSVKAQVPKEGKTTLYCCREGVCESPICEPAEIMAAIANL